MRVNGDPWELYNLMDDPTELNNLVKQMPGKAAELIQAYEDYLKT